MVPCWVCSKPLVVGQQYVGWDGSRWFVTDPGSDPGRRATHLDCSPDPKAGAPMTSADEAALDAGINPWKARRDMGVLGEEELR
jgi:hypothetical protein